MKLRIKCKNKESLGQKFLPTSQIGVIEILLKRKSYEIIIYLLFQNGRNVAAGVVSLFKILDTFFLTF